MPENYKSETTIKADKAFQPPETMRLILNFIVPIASLLSTIPVALAWRYGGVERGTTMDSDDAAVLEPHHILAESERSAAVYQEPVPDLDPRGLQWALLAGECSALFGAIDDVELYSCIYWRGCSSYPSTAGY